MNSTISFIPRQPQFWWFHGSGLSIFTVLQLALFYLQQAFFNYNALATVVIFPLFTLAVLLFRWLYKYYAWYSLSILKQILLVLLCAFVMGGLVVTGLSAITMPFFWHELFDPATLADQGFTSQFDAFVEFFLLNVISQAFIALLWCVIYIGVTYNRRAQQAELDILHLENHLKEAQLVSLTNQLNPHFLFNCLNNIRFMIHENADYADEMITAFSEILRYSLTQAKQEKVQLAQELAITERYMDVVKLQLDNKVGFNLNAQGIDMRSLVPPMSLHLLVENAVKHGIENIKAPCELTLNISQHAEQLTIEVINPMPKKASRINLQSKSTGLGLTNIKQRLMLLYGEHAKLHTQAVDHQFIAQLSIPLEQG